MRVNRLELLQALQTVQAGLSPRDIVEQSSCFVFKKGEVLTYNDEVACRFPTKVLGDLEGAVAAKPLTAILALLPEDDVEIEAGENVLLVVGKRRKVKIRMEAEITLPIEHVDKPGKNWQKLDEDFAEALSIVQECAGKDESQFIMTCVHIHSRWIEACDNYHLTRYKIETPIKEECLVRKQALKNIVDLEMQEFTESQSWVHFRNPAGLILSCRRYLEEYPDLLGFIKFKGDKTELPKGLADAANRAEVFSAENVDENAVLVEIKQGKLRITGTGSSGKYQEVKSVRYNGPDLAFRISPKMIKELVSKHTECEIGDNKLKVHTGKWVYVVSLKMPENGKKEPKE